MVEAGGIEPPSAGIQLRRLHAYPLLFINPDSAPRGRIARGTSPWCFASLYGHPENG